MIDAMLSQYRKMSLKHSHQMTIGKLIEALTMIKQEVPDAEVYFDFCGFFPTGIDSWRGIYEELALNYKKDGEPMSINNFLAMLKQAIGQTFTGYKGGEYTMHADTPLWVANGSEVGNTAVVGAIDDGVNVYLLTTFVEAYDW